MALPDKFHLAATNLASEFTLTSSRTVSSDYPIANLYDQRSGIFAAFDMTAQTALNIYGTDATAWDINCLSLHNHTITNGSWRVRLYSGESQAGELLYDSGSAYADFDGTNDTSTTSDTASNSVTGDFTAIVCIALDDITPAATQAVFSKWEPTGNQRAFQVNIRTGGQIAVESTPDGTSGSSVSCVTTSTLATAAAADGSPIWLKVDYDVNNGASGRTMTVRYSLQPSTTDLEDLTWTTLQAITQAGVTTIYDSTAALTVAALTSLSSPFAGQIYRAVLKNGIDGTTVSDFDPHRWTSGTTFGSSVSGETWTLNNGASVVASGESIEHPYASANNWKSNLSKWFDTVSAKSFQIDVTVSGTLNNQILIDKLFLGEAISADSGQSRESSVTIEDGSIQLPKADGGTHTVTMPASRRALIDVPIMGQTDMEAIRAALRTAKRGGDVLMTMDPNDAFGFKEASTAVYRVASDRQLVTTFYNNFPTRIALREN